MHRLLVIFRETLRNYAKSNSLNAQLGSRMKSDVMLFCATWFEHPFLNTYSFHKNIPCSGSGIHWESRSRTYMNLSTNRLRNDEFARYVEWRRGDLPVWSHMFLLTILSHARLLRICKFWQNSREANAEGGTNSHTMNFFSNPFVKMTE